MKKYALLMGCILLFSCKQEEKKFFKSGDVTIKGKIENFSLKDSIYSIPFYSNAFLSTEPYQTNNAKIDADGNFSVRFKIPHKQVIFFHYKESASLYIEPNQIINVNFDGSLLEKKSFLNSLKITGALAKKNDLIQKYSSNDPIDYKKYYKNYQSKKTPKELYRFIDSVYNNKGKYIDDFIKNNDVPKDLIHWLTVEKEIKPITELLQYAVFYFRPKSKEKTFEEGLGKKYIERLSKMPKLKQEHFINREIYTILPNYFAPYHKKVIQGKYKVDYKKFDSIFYQKELLANYKENPAFAKILFFDRINSSLKNNDLTFYNKNKTIIDSLFKNTIYEKSIHEKYAFSKNLVENPILPEKTELLKFSSDDATTFLDEIFKNANGKVIYIDNWATWCAPCKEQFKEATPKLKKKFSKDVEFIYLCHLSDEKLYKPTIAQYKVEGKHYFITKEQNKILKKLLNITGYPTYNIINKKGKLVHSGFEFRPSESKTTKILKDLMNK